MSAVISKPISGTIFRASAIMAGSTLAVMLASVAKSKVAALVMGPSGVGMLGMLQSILTSAAIFGGMGLQGATVQHVAAAREQHAWDTLCRLRKLSILGPLTFGTVTAGVLVVLRNPIAQEVTGDRSNGWAVAWLGLGVVAAALAGGSIGWVNGFRRIGDIARINIGSAVLGAVVGSAALVWSRNNTGIVIYLVAYPAANLLFAWWYARKPDVPRQSQPTSHPDDLLRSVFRLGIVPMVGVLLAAATQMVVRSYINSTLGIAAAGHFQAAWNISMLYLGFLLGAMATDYYPRLSECLVQPARMIHVVDEQCYAAIVLTAPVILAMFLLAPLVVHILYSRAFDDAAVILRWQLLGDLFKVPAWAIGYVLLAERRSVALFGADLVWNALYCALLWVGIPRWGLSVVGCAFLISYAVYFVALYVMLRMRLGPLFGRSTTRLMLVVLAAALVVAGIHGRFRYALLIQLPIVIALSAHALIILKGSLFHRHPRSEAP